MYALLSKDFARVDAGSYGWDVSSHTVLIVSHLTTTSSSKVISGFREISSSCTGRVELAALQYRLTPECMVISWLASMRVWATVLRNDATIISLVDALVALPRAAVDDPEPPPTTEPSSST
jgi:hypothetical protein